MKKVRPLLGLLIVVAAGLLYVSHGNVSRLMSLPNLMTRPSRPGAATVPSRAPMPVTGKPGAPSAGAPAAPPGTTQAAAPAGTPAASPGGARGTPGATPPATSAPAPAKGGPTPAGVMPAAPAPGTPGQPPAQGASPAVPPAGPGTPATPGKPGAVPPGGEPQPGAPAPAAQTPPNPNSEAAIVGSGPRGRQDPFIPLATPGFGGGVPSLPLPPLPGQLPGQLPGFTSPGIGAGGGGRMRVAGIMGSRSRVAIIESDGRTYIVGEGERVGGAVVVSILPEKVVLKENNVTFELNIGGEQSS